MAEDARLRDLREELLAAGLLEGTDFAVHGAGGGVPLGSEVVVLRAEGEGWRVGYRDMGRERELLVADDWVAVRGRFVGEVLVMAGERGRGPRAEPGRARSVSLSELRQERE